MIAHIRLNLYSFLFIFFCCITSLSAQTANGVLQYDEEKSMDGYIFFSSTHDKESYLIDNCGRLINKWEGTRSSGLSSNLMPTGQVLRVEKVSNSCCPQASVGGRIELRDWDNNLIWEYFIADDQMAQHHDFTLMPNGNILVLGWELIDENTQQAYGKQNVTFPHLWGEFVYELEPVGSSDANIVWEWHLQDHFVQDKFPTRDNFGDVSEEIGKLDINYQGPSHWSDRDWFHCNAIDYNPSRDEILINSRNIHELWIIDHSTTTEEAKGSTGGNKGKGGELLFRWGNPEASKNGNTSDLKMFGSHGHEWIKPGLPNEGKIIFFNNGDERPAGYYSTAEMIDPIIGPNDEYVRNSGNVYQLYEQKIIYGQDPFSLASTYLSNAQQLENGNFFINEGNEGRLLEVTDQGEVVWEYVVPIRYDSPIGQGITNRFNSFRAYKYPPDYPGFEGQDMAPGELIELTSLDICNLIDTTVDNDGDGFFAGTDCDDENPEITIPGTECSDGNPHTSNDVVNVACICEGNCLPFEGPDVVCETGSNFIRLSWDDDPLAESYFIFGSTSNGTTFEIETQSSEATIENLNENDLVFITIFVVDISGCFTSVSLECVVNSVSNDNIDSAFTISPNPVDNILNLRNIDAFQFAEVYDASGQKLIETRDGNPNIDVSQLQSGVYILALFDESHSAIGVKKFVKGK